MARSKKKSTIIDELHDEIEQAVKRRVQDLIRQRWAILILVGGMQIITLIILAHIAITLH